jgi:Ran-binding protein 1
VVTGDWKLVDLPELPKVTGEEQEEEIAKFKSKIYRFHDKQWKERGVGELRFLKHRTSGMIRILNRAEKTHKCIMNHYVINKDEILGKLEQLKTSNNTWTWAAQDISDEESKIEKFCAKFTSKDDFEKFQTFFKESCESNSKILSKSHEEAEKEEKKEDNKEEKKE